VCPFCEESDDNFEHALYKCDLSKHTWSNFQTWLNGQNIDIRINVSNIIMGVKSSIPFGPLINTIMLQIKRILLSPSESRRALSTEEINRIVRIQYQVESITVKKANPKLRHNKFDKYKQRWAHLIGTFDE